MRRLLTGLLSATLVLGACGDDDDPEDTAAVTSIPDETSSSTSSTTEPAVPPPDVIPSDLSLITEEYVEQVVNALFIASNDALLLTRNTGLVDEEVVATIEAITSGSQTENALSSLVQSASDGFRGITAEPTGLRATVRDVIEATNKCAVAEITIDRTGVTDAMTTEPAGTRSFVVIRAASPDELDAGLNPTAWTVAALPVTTDGATPRGQCEGSA